MNELSAEDKLNVAAEHINAIWKEGKNQARMLVIETYHQIGQTIMQLPTKSESVCNIARLTGISERSLYYAAAFYEKFPDLSSLPEGKDAPWSRIIHKYLTQSEKDEPHEHVWESWLICKCGERKHELPE